VKQERKFLLFLARFYAASMATSVSRNFRAVSQLAGDPARELAALVRIREGGGFEMSLQILVANPLQVKFSAQNDLGTGGCLPG